MRNWITILTATILLSGCVSVKLEDAVEDSVSATKDLYTSVKRKRDGKEVRVFSHSTPIVNGLSEADTAIECLETLSTIVKNSIYADYDVIGQNTSARTENSESSFVDCELSIEVDSA